MIIKQRDIFLITISFPGYPEEKKRPVMVLSHSKHNSSQKDILICAITSSKSRFFNCISITDKDMLEGNLKKVSVLRYDQVFTIDKDLIIHNIGKLNMKKSTEVVDKLSSLIEIVE